MAEIGTVRGLRDMGSEPTNVKTTCPNKNCKVHNRPTETVELPSEEDKPTPKKRAAPKKAAPKSEE